MSSRHLTQLAAFGVAITVAMTLSTTAFSATEDVDTLTVTAHRIATIAVPKVDRIDAAQIERRDHFIGPDVLETLPGFAVSRNGAFGSQAQIRVRGAEANHLQVLVDGIEINDPAIGSEYDFAHLNLAGVEAIEFLPGAQSALWGSDALAGVLNLRTTPQARERSISVTGGSFDTWQARARLADVLERGHYALALSSYDTDGTNTAFTGDEDDGYENQHAHFNGGIEQGVWRGELVLRYTDTRGEFDPTPFPGFVPVDGDQRFDHEEFASKIAIGAELLDGRWQPELAVTYLETDNENRANGAVTSTTAGKRVRISLQHHFEINAQHAITGILEHEAEDFEQTGTASIFGDPNQTQEISAQSVALEHIGRFGALSTAVSARFDSNDDFDDAFSFRLAGRYRIDEQWQAFAALGTAIKNPSFFERFGFTPDTFIGNPDLQPECNRHWSLGVSWLGEQWSVTATYFNDQLQDEINGFVFDAAGGGFTADNIDADSDRQGVELQATGQLGALDISAGYTYLDAEDPSGIREQRRPRHSGHAQIGWAFAADKGYLQIGGTFVGAQLDTDFGTFSPVELDAYNRVHASASYQLTPALRIRARVENLLDEETTDVFGFRAPKRGGFVTLSAQL